MRWSPRRIETHVSPHCLWLDGMSILQERMVPFVSEPNTHLAQESEKLTKVPGEGGTVVGLTKWASRLSDNVCELQNGCYLISTLWISLAAQSNQRHTGKGILEDVVQTGQADRFSIPFSQMRKPRLRSCSEHIFMDHTVHKTLLSCEELILCSLGLGLQSTLRQRDKHVTQNWSIREPHPLGQWLTHKWALAQNGPIRTFLWNFLLGKMWSFSLGGLLD